MEAARAVALAMQADAHEECFKDLEFKSIVKVLPNMPSKTIKLTRKGSCTRGNSDPLLVTNLRFCLKIVELWDLS